MEELYKQFRQLHPKAFFLDPSQIEELSDHLRGLGWLAKEESILSLEKPGEGNMNCVFRVKTDQRSFILKQARPWVEKYPHIEAPVSRASVEAKFLGITTQTPDLQVFSPSLLGFDAKNFLLAIEDLGEGIDYSFLYQKDKEISQKELDGLLSYLNALHSLDPQQVAPDFPDNLPMRRLNHEHIFNFPFMEENGFDLDTVQEGLQGASLIYKRNSSLKQRIQKLGQRYLTAGDTLLHGDYYPGSWLQVGEGVKVIDPEFSFVGPKEWDVAVFMAHMKLSGQASASLAYIWSRYQHAGSIDRGLLAGFAGTAVLRRLIGIAQLPIAYPLAEKQQLMAEASTWIETGNIEELT